MGHEEPVGTEDGNKEESWRWDEDPRGRARGRALSWKGVDGIPAAKGSAGASWRVGRARRCCGLCGDVLWLWGDS